MGGRKNLELLIFLRIQTFLTGRFTKKRPPEIKSRRSFDYPLRFKNLEGLIFGKTFGV